MCDDKNKNKELSKINEINEHFHIPIFYNNNKVELNKNIIGDLELIGTVDPSNNSIYSFCFNVEPDNNLSKKIAEQSAKFYTTDTDFLKQTQQLLKEYKPLNKNIGI